MPSLLWIPAPVGLLGVGGGGAVLPMNDLPPGRSVKEMALHSPQGPVNFSMGVPVKSARLKKKKNGLFRKRNEVKGPWGSSSVFSRASSPARLPNPPASPSLTLRPLQLHLQAALCTRAQALKPSPLSLSTGLTGGQMGLPVTRPWG